MATSSLQVVFNRIIAGEVVTVLFYDEKAYNSARVSLLRKFRNLKDLYDSIGADHPYTGKYLQCSIDRKELLGKFMIADESERKNTPNSLKFQVQEL